MTAEILRYRIPHTSYGEEKTRKLYNRFHALKNKARARDVPFEWGAFPYFLDSLQKMAPDDYDPDTHRVRFDLARGEGYKESTMMIAMAGTSAKDSFRDQKSVQKVRKAENLGDFSTELAILMLTESGTMEHFLKTASALAD